MEKAILKTLIYADIFDYPLKAYEIHKWLIGRKTSLRQVEKTLERLNQESRIRKHGAYYFLPKRVRLVIIRKRREKQSGKFLLKTKIASWFLKVIPWVKLVGISGGLAMGNADKKDDIDLFLVTSKNRLWITRLLTVGLLDFLGVRRKAKMKLSVVSGKLCVNILLEEDKLTQDSKDIFVSHEVLQMKVLWQRYGIYSKYLTDNEWAFKFLPNWTTSQVKSAKFKVQSERSKFKVFDFMDNLAKKFQLKIMNKPKGMERIEDGALYFHPQDCRLKVLKEYNLRIKKLY